MHNEQIESARRSIWSIYEMANMSDILDIMGSPDICLYIFPL